MIVRVLLPIKGGHKYQVIEIEIGDNCPVCDEPRGKITNSSFRQDGELLTCDTWQNACGHQDDDPKKVRAEARAILKVKMRDKLEVVIESDSEDIALAWTKTWDREAFIKHLEKFQEQMKEANMGLVTNNIYDLKGCITIDMKLDNAYIKGTATLIRFTPELNL